MEHRCLRSVLCGTRVGIHFLMWTPIDRERAFDHLARLLVLTHRDCDETNDQQQEAEFYPVDAVRRMRAVAPKYRTE